MAKEEFVDHPLKGETIEVIIKEYSELLARALNSTSIADARISYVNEIKPLHNLIMFKTENAKIRSKFETLNEQLYIRLCIRDDERAYLSKEIT